MEPLEPLSAAAPYDPRQMDAETVAKAVPGVSPSQLIALECLLAGQHDRLGPGRGRQPQDAAPPAAQRFQLSSRPSIAADATSRKTAIRFWTTKPTVAAKREGRPNNPVEWKGQQEQ